MDYLIDERGEAIDIPNDFQEKRNLLRSLMNVRMPLEISNEFLRVQDDFLTGETLGKVLTSPEDISEVKGRMMLWQGDITTLKVDGIVNAANSKLLGCFIFKMQEYHNFCKLWMNCTIGCTVFFN